MKPKRNFLMTTVLVSAWAVAASAAETGRKPAAVSLLSVTMPRPIMESRRRI